MTCFGEEAFAGRVDGSKENHDPEKCIPYIRPDAAAEAQESDENDAQHIKQNARQSRFLAEFEPEFLADEFYNVSAVQNSHKSTKKEGFLASQSEESLLGKCLIIAVGVFDEVVIGSLGTWLSC